MSKNKFPKTYPKRSEIPKEERLRSDLVTVETEDYQYRVMTRKEWESRSHSAMAHLVDEE